MLVDVLDIALPEVLHQERCTGGFGGGEQQVHVIGHEHVRVDGAAEALREFAQVVPVEEVVFLGEEAHATVVAALDDVQRDTGSA